MFNTGCVVSDFITRQMITVEIPYFSKTLFETFDQATANGTSQVQIRFFARDRASTKTFRVVVLGSVGEDWMCGYLLPTPLYNLAPMKGVKRSTDKEERPLSFRKASEKFETLRGNEVVSILKGRDNNNKPVREDRSRSSSLTERKRV